MQYEKKILNALLDSYERSSLSRKENIKTVHISFSITEKTMPAYFDENSLAFETIHAAAEHLEELGFARSVWKNGKKNHILQKLILCEENVNEIYQYLGRIPKKERESEQLNVLEELEKECTTPIAGKFIHWLIQRLKDGKTVKEYLELDNTEKTRSLIRAVCRLETNQKEIYVREFSVRCFGDSKELEKRMGLIGKVMRKFSDVFTEWDNDAVFAEYGVYRTPNYVYMKGSGSLRIGSCDSDQIHLAGLKQGIGLAGEDLDSLEWERDSSVKKIITVENLTTFFRWEEADSILIYLGGYHNAVRRKLLQKLYETFPGAEYLHFGDIDVGGFEIYRDLCIRTKIPFQTYKMGISELKKYEPYTKKLTVNDERRLKILLKDREYESVWPVLKYMKERGIKLEQESILLR